MHEIEIREPSATDLVLDLLFGHPERTLPVQALARGAEVMGIGTPSVRVALTRLQRQGPHRQDGARLLRGAAGGQSGL
ncbi:hypothetical protein ACU4GD_13210 [Cupriavidus basilensis]